MSNAQTRPVWSIDDLGNIGLMPHWDDFGAVLANIAALPDCRFVCLLPERDVTAEEEILLALVFSDTLRHKLAATENFVPFGQSVVSEEQAIMSAPKQGKVRTRILADRPLTDAEKKRRQCARLQGYIASRETNWKCLGIDEANFPWFMAQLDRQNWKCAICQIAVDTSACLDHDHATGEKRGILCHTCNRLLGKYEDGVIKAFMDGVDSYLERSR